MEKAAYELSKEFSKYADLKLICWSGSNKWLIFVLPVFFVKSIWFTIVQKIDVVYLQDALLTPIGYVLRLLGKPVGVTINGRDIVYENKLYQFIISKTLKKLDRIICVSSYLREECLKRGVVDSRIIVIPNGVTDNFFLRGDKSHFKLRVKDNLGLDFMGKKVLLSVGRLVSKKGFRWFVDNVAWRILEGRDDVVYIIVGRGPLKDKIQKIIRQAGLKHKVFLLDKIDNDELKLLYNSSDIFIMPNVEVKGDVEGFPLVILESSSCKLPIVASGVKELRDSVKDKVNGIVVKPYHINGFVFSISYLLDNDKEREELGEGARRYVLENYRWSRIALKYLGVFKEMVEASIDYPR